MTKKIVDGNLVDFTPAEEAAFAERIANPPPVPQLPITKTQAMVALHRTGKLNAVKAAVAQNPEDQIWFDNAQVWHRDNPRIKALAPAVGLTDKDLDDLFTLAKTVTE